MGVYIVHPKCENTRMPKILAYKRDKVVIYQNGVVWHQIYKNHRAVIFAMQENFASIAKISLAKRNFASLAKFYRDSKIGNFRYQQ